MAVALASGPSLTTRTVTLLLRLGLLTPVPPPAVPPETADPPESLRLVRVIVRDPAVGSSALLF